MNQNLENVGFGFFTDRKFGYSNDELVHVGIVHGTDSLQDEQLKFEM